MLKGKWDLHSEECSDRVELIESVESISSSLHSYYSVLRELIESVESENRRLDKWIWIWNS